MQDTKNLSGDLRQRLNMTERLLDSLRYLCNEQLSEVLIGSENNGAKENAYAWMWDNYELVSTLVDAAALFYSDIHDSVYPLCDPVKNIKTEDKPSGGFRKDEDSED